MKIRGRTAGDIGRSIEQELHGGRLPPGAPLPPIRELAATLRVSPATVAAAYKALRTRGLVCGSGRGGTRVAPHPPSPVSNARAAVAAGLIDLATGNPDPLLLPPLDGALRAITHAPRLYGEPAESAPLTRFAAAELEADGIHAPATTIVSGALDGIERLLREHLRPGDAVAVEDPGFPALLDLLAAAGFAPLPVALDEEGLRPDPLAVALSRARALILTPRAQNPTGAVMTSARAADLRRILRTQAGLLLIENDPVSAVAGAPAITLSGAVSRWAIVRSVSKFLGPDLRLAVVAGDELTIARVEGRHALGPRWVSSILQQLALSLWSDPASGRLLARAGEIYAQRRAAMLAALAARGIAASGRSGFNVWIPVRQEAAVVAALAERGWGVMPGERFRLRAPPAIRVTVSTLTAADAERFADDLSHVPQFPGALLA
jgi:DNA-binding transcriptional MocR family regulator